MFPIRVPYALGQAEEPPVPPEVDPIDVAAHPLPTGGDVTLENLQAYYADGAAGTTPTVSSTRQGVLARLSAAALSHVASVARAITAARVFDGSITHTASVVRAVTAARMSDGSVTHAASLVWGLATTRVVQASIAHTASLVWGLATSRVVSATLTGAPSAEWAVTAAREAVAGVTLTPSADRAVAASRSGDASVQHAALMSYVVTPFTEEPPPDPGTGPLMFTPLVPRRRRRRERFVYEPLAGVELVPSMTYTVLPLGRWLEEELLDLV